MSDEGNEGQRPQPPLGELERAFIDEFVRMRGYDPAKLAHLPAPEREALLKEASTYASSKLTEVESRSRYLGELHDGTPRKPRKGP